MRYLIKAHISGYTRKDGTYVAAHTDKRLSGHVDHAAPQKGKKSKAAGIVVSIPQSPIMALPEEMARYPEAIKTALRSKNLEMLNDTVAALKDFVPSSTIKKLLQYAHAAKVYLEALPSQPKAAMPPAKPEMPTAVTKGLADRMEAAGLEGDGERLDFLISMVAGAGSYHDQVLLQYGQAFKAYIAAKTADKGHGQSVPSAVPSATSAKLAQIPWEKQFLPDSNTNAKSHNKKVAQIKALADAGDVAALEALTFGSNTYGKKQSLLVQTVLAALKVSGPYSGKTSETSPVTAPISDSVKLPQIPWDKQFLPDSNTNAKSHNKKVSHIKALAEAGDIAALEALTFGSNTYGKKQSLLAQAVLAALKEKDTSKEGDTKPGADGLLVFHNGRWHKQEEELPSAVSEPKSNGVTSETAVSHPSSVKIVSMTGWKQTGPQTGSNPGGKFKDTKGVEWYCKFPNDPDAARSEALAAHLYAAAGIVAPEIKLVEKDGVIGVASRWIPSLTKAKSATALVKAKGVYDGFAIDAWLGNRDVVGLSYDNLLIGSDGKANRIDVGGSLEYRAQGKPKAFGEVPKEIDSLRDKSLNPKAAAVFGKMTDADITASVERLLPLSEQKITDLVMAYGPGNEDKKKELASLLCARRSYLLVRFSAAGKTTRKKLDPEKLPVDPKRLPKRHDFANWNGPDKGLSSQPHVNAANNTVEKELLDVAQSGNLPKLKAFQFHEIDKISGSATGKLQPIAQHPSKHVVQFHADLVQVLEEVLNPPEPLKNFRATDLDSLAELIAAFPPKPFGTTVQAVQSNQKLGFWIVLGKVQGAQKFMPSQKYHYTPNDVAKGFDKYKQGTKLARHFIKSVQASGSYNDLFRDGKTEDHQGNKLSDVAQAALAHATEMPEGTAIYRWQAMTDAMVEKVLSAAEGTVFQATGSMCASYSESDTKGFGKHRVVIRYAKGAKAVDSFGSGKFESEKEVTTLPNSRFVILSRKMVPDVEHGNPSSKRLELEVLMLPPDLGL